MTGDLSSYIRTPEATINGIRRDVCPTVAAMIYIRIADNVVQDDVATGQQVRATTVDDGTMKFITLLLINVLMRMVDCCCCCCLC